MSKQPVQRHPAQERIQALARDPDMTSELTFVTEEGLSLVIGREVFSPQAIPSSSLFAAALPVWEGGMTLLDVGTGTGVIPLLLARRCPLLRVVATDISAPACANARANLERHGLPVDVRCGSVFEPIGLEER